MGSDWGQVPPAAQLAGPGPGEELVGHLDSVLAGLPGAGPGGAGTVSYTHLTLPTILRV